MRSLKLRSARIDDRAITIDGHIDEAAWQSVPLLPELVQAEPRYGAPPTQRTEVRVAYGQDGLYVAFDCFGEPDEVRGAYSRKDQLAPSDQVWFEIDANNDDTTGFVFATNPSSAQYDAQLSRDSREDLLWDGVWQAVGRKNEHGWSAELFIPWSTLRFESQEEHTFGINIGRWSNELGEAALLSPTPQGLPGRLSYALDYEGVRGVEPGLNLELRPYVSSRVAVQRPEGSLDYSWPVMPNGGYDVKYGLTGTLTLDLTVNPDFGQAEVDPAVLNLGPFEVFFPERRQFFLESKEIFETRFQTFYSRRIGAAPRPSDADLTGRDVGGARETGELVELDPLTRILGAARLTGNIGPNWRVGALTATTGPTYGVERFSDDYQRPVTVEPTTQYSVLRVRREFDSLTSVGMMATAVNRVGDDPDAFTGGFDYRLRFRDRWRHTAQVIATHDGDEAGVGASGDVIRTSKNTEVSLRGELLTPGANFNDLGYMRFANYIDGEATVAVFNAQPVGKLRRLVGSVNTRLQSSFRGELMQKQLMTRVAFTTMGQWGLGYWAGGHLPQLDLYETRGNIPYEVPLHWYTGGDLNTPDNRRIVGVLRWAYGEQNGLPGPDLGVELRLRPVDRLQLTLSYDLNSSFGRPRWVTEEERGELPVFARGDIITMTTVLRGTIGILPTLTLQTYNQLLYTTARHDEFFYLTAPDVLVTLSRVQSAPYVGVVDQGLTSLISNSILRWEYTPGSFLFLAYTHRTALGEGGAPVAYRPGNQFANLVAPGARDEDILFVKMVYLFGF
ncbi:MAG: carbohydrate binding family 9 domain-containing protein [Myxococcales bacterium]|nr:carbohydrate binding family 9 domain-containing protein [Myxococcales bacterium]